MLATVNSCPLMVACASGGYTRWAVQTTSRNDNVSKPMGTHRRANTQFGHHDRQASVCPEETF